MRSASRAAEPVAHEEIIRGRGTQFDRMVVDLFERVLDTEPAAA